MCRAELRSPDPEANPYLAFTLLIYAGLYGYKNELYLPPVSDVSDTESASELLPQSLGEAKREALASSFIKEFLPERLIGIYCE